MNLVLLWTFSTLPLMRLIEDQAVTEMPSGTIVRVLQPGVAGLLVQAGKKPISETRCVSN
jgi:hypothetical protein